MAGGHSSLRCFEASGEFLHVSYKGVPVSPFRSNHVQISARNTSKGAPAVTPRLSNGQGALYWPEQGCSPLHPHRFASKPFPQYFHHPFFCWCQGGAIDNLCGEVMLQHVEAVMGLWRGDTFPCTLAGGPELAGARELEGLCSGVMPCPLLVQDWGSTAFNLRKAACSGMPLSLSLAFLWLTNRQKYICSRIIYIENWTQDFVFVNSAVISAVWTKGRVYFPSI